jgi:uncharacterized protein YndB with AHSA1/START domain
MERSSRQQRQIDAPIEHVWELVGDPNRHPEWWPSVEVAECSTLGEGCRYRAVIKNPLGREEEHELEIESFDDCRRITISCADVGMSTNFVLAEAGGGTFVDAEFGVEANSLGMKVFASVAGRRYLRSWLAKSLAGLDAAATGAGRAAA